MKNISSFARSMELRFGNEEWYRFVGVGDEPGKECIFVYVKYSPGSVILKAIQEYKDFPVTIRVIGSIRPC